MEAASGIPPSCVFHISEHLSPFPRLSEERALPAGLSMQVSGGSVGMVVMCSFKASSLVGLLTTTLAL